LVSRVREEAASSEVQKERLDRLYQLSQQLLVLKPDVELGQQFLEPFRKLFGVTAICMFDAETADLRTVGNSRDELADKTRDAYISGHDLDDSDSRISIRCLRIGARMLGAIGFQDLRDPGETAHSLTGLTAGLLERTSAFRRASAAAAAAQTEVYRSAMLDALAHEFKTPLSIILAAAGGIREAGPLAAEQMEMADTVENEAARLGSLTSRLLRTARLDSEEVRPRMELIDVTSLVSNIAGRYMARSSDRLIVLTNGRDEVEVLADPELLRLTVNQLIENACKYSQPGSTVTIEIERQGEFVAVRVSNTGSSIPRDEQRHIFERFYRGADAKRSTSGSGLGLYVARKIAVAHGGALDLEIGERMSDGVTICLKIPGTREESKYALSAK
jgi:two-component system sensor histidine kinase KdpD